MAAYQYQSLHEVPVPWRTYKGARLTLEQVQAIVNNADKISKDNSALATARKEFEKSHRIENGMWLKGSKS
jgi:hypothetical protein